jgi:hypothetical protein
MSMKIYADRDWVKENTASSWNELKDKPFYVEVDGEGNEIIHKLDPKYLPAISGSGVDVTAEVGQTIVVEKVDANGKPTKWKVAEYQPRTHWSEYVVLYEGIPEYDGEGGALVFTAPAPTIGNTYKVICNGAEYVCVCADSAVMGEPGAYVLGNVSAMMGTGDTGEPFFMTYVDGIWAGVMLDGTTSVNLTLKERQHTPIPVEYVSNAFPYYIEVTGDGTDESPYVCHDTVENVDAIFASGRTMFLRHRIYVDGVLGAEVRYFHSLSVMESIAGFNHTFIFVDVSTAIAVHKVIRLKAQDDGTYKVLAIEKEEPN